MVLVIVDFVILQVFLSLLWVWIWVGVWMTWLFVVLTCLGWYVWWFGFEVCLGRVCVEY